ncbi:MAG: metallophosphoesterase [Halanaerobiales bacterium]|nr:metallophosphoesterase [Halanaerobiales bacterium]
MLYLIIIITIGYLSYKLIDYHTHDIEINRQTVKSNKINKEINILHLSDLHLDFDKKYQEKIIKYINGLDYDLILFTGDYIKEKSNIINLDLFLKKIENIDNSYAVLGNNDHNYDLKRIVDIFNNNNIELLINSSKQFLLKNNKVNIMGVDTPDLKKDNYQKSLNNITIKDSFNIILSHTYHILTRDIDQEIDLVLLGDTHGGQIDIPYLSELLLKNRFDIKYKKGKYQLDTLTIFVNKGLGTNILPFRINCKPEISLITVTSTD